MKTFFENNRYAGRIGSHTYYGKIRCGRRKQAKSMDTVMKTSEYAMVCVMQGRGYYEDQERIQHAFVAPCIFQRFPDQTHRITWCEPSYTLFIAAPSSVYETLKFVTTSERIKHPVIQDVDPSDFFREEDILFNMLNELPENQLMIALNRIQTLFTRVLTESQSENSSILTKVDQYIEQAISKKILLSDIAVNLGMSESSFKVKFTEAAGISPGKYIIQKRLSYAAKRLLEGDERISEIADKLGYPDIYTFSRQFKKFYQCTPSQYRKKTELF
ncbi:MAG: AraC family transcriptional regulator [Lentisphaeria bacterium]|nr:AraC family transcriptional regulator [Lentisphaeria bacterium]